MHFIKQAEKSTLCGPVAVHNLLISLNKNTITLQELIKLTNWNSRVGVTNRGIVRALKSLGLNFISKRGVKLPYVIKQLNKGYKVMFSYQMSKSSAHVVLFIAVKKKDNKFHLLTINDISDKGRFKIKRWISIDYYNGKSKQFGTYCSWRRFKMPQCWVIK